MNMRGQRSLQLQAMKAHVKNDKEKVEMQSSWVMDAEKPCTSNRSSSRERKMALQQDVDKLKKRLRHEENVHRALERAFTRPLGALPRLPPYLPKQTLELLAEVAVLEEEVARLEEKLVQFRQGMYQEAVYISSSKKMEIKDHEQKQSTLLVASEADSVTKNLPSHSDEKRGKENQSSTNTVKNKQQSPNSKVQSARTHVKKRPTERKSGERRLDPQRSQLEMRMLDHETTAETNPANHEAASPMDGSPNNISESILKCLMKIFMRMSSMKNRTSTETLPSQSVAYSFDPYDLCTMFEKRDIGPYKHLIAIKSSSIDPNRTTISVFLVQRLRILFRKLATVDLKGLSHQEKLAFWINIYNSCMMNAFLEYGISEDPESVFELLQKATVSVGGHILNAITIEHFILRLPYHSKNLSQTVSKSTKCDETMARSMFGLELSEPLVTFALSCGSWSSPAVRVYTASQVENELEAAKRDYLQAAVGISTIREVISIPKLLDWYLLDFAKDFESLVDWICLQLPSELGKEAIKCLESRKDVPLLQFIQIQPYEFSFRYLLHT